MLNTPRPELPHATGRRALLGAAAAALLATSVSAQAQFKVQISGVGATQLPIAIAKFRDEERNTPSLSISAIVRADLERSGVFRATAGNGALDENSQPVFAEWRSLPVDALAAGSVTRLADGRFDVRFKLWDVVKGNVIAGHSSAVEAGDLRLAAHRISDAIYEKLTGVKGVFSTRIAFVTKGAGRFTLRVADADGENWQVAANSNEPIISPAWSPDGKQLAYVSFDKKKPVVVTQDVASGARREVANFRGSNSAPAWSNDGQMLAVTLSRDTGSQLYLVDRSGNIVRRLTTSNAIDTEPAFAPDGVGVYFVSDRGGGPQIYRTTVSGGNAERITFGGAYNISPAISPDGRTLAYISRQGGGYKLYTLDLSAAGAQPQALTDSSDDESPSFAPNGKLIIYATRAGGRDVLMTTTLDGKIKATLPSPAGDLREPVWGPYGR